jgi:hypothetical protein
MIGRYLLGKPPGSGSIALYEKAAHHRHLLFSAREKRYWNKCLRFPLLLPFIDAALAISDSRSPVRRKVLIMLAILESDREYHTYFLPRRRSVFYPLVLLFRGGLALIKTIIGYLLLWTL